MQPWHFIIGFFALIIAIFILVYMKEKKRNWLKYKKPQKKPCG